jgi:hypothetical protein
MSIRKSPSARPSAIDRCCRQVPAEFYLAVSAENYLSVDTAASQELQRPKFGGGFPKAEQTSSDTPTPCRASSASTPQQIPPYSASEGARPHRKQTAQEPEDCFAGSVRASRSATSTRRPQGTRLRRREPPGQRGRRLKRNCKNGNAHKGGNIHLIGLREAPCARVRRSEGSA